MSEQVIADTETTRLTLERDELDALIFDLDGVLTDTAGLHAAAWKRMFDGYRQELLDRGDEAFEPFDEQADYRKYVDGKPRYDGVKSFLKARGIDLPYGDPEDEPDSETICGLGNRKNQYFQEVIQDQGADLLEGVVDQLEYWKEVGFKAAVVSSSENCKQLIESAGIEKYFDSRVDGATAKGKNLQGKPAPDYFLAAAEELGVDPERAAVFEDAVSGVQAGRRGKFGLVVGIDRTGDADLDQHGADVVISGLHQIAHDGSAQAETAEQEPAPAMQSALDQIDSILERFETRRPVVFLDYDGTLTPIVNRPDEANLSDSMRDVLRSLIEVCQVAIVSGRDLQDVRQRVRIDELIYAGSHGYDIAGPDGMKRQPEEAKQAVPEVDSAETELHDKIGRIEGVEFERKAFSLAVHYRNVEQGQVQTVRDAVKDAVKHREHLRIGEGKCVDEIQPDIDWHKGKAVTWLLKTLDLDEREVMPVYIGDDTTDEDAFRALAGVGISILVASEARPSAATYVLEDPEEVERFLNEVVDARKPASSPNDWKLVYRNYDSKQQPLREALCTLGNGLYATRGAFEESSAGGEHYPGTYMACGYDRAETEISGKIIENEDLVNWPNWLCLSFRMEGGPWLDLSDMELLDFRQELDLKKGILCRRMRMRDREGRVTLLQTKRFMHMDRPHYAGIQWILTPENWSGRIEVRSALDGTVTNSGVARYRDLEGHHLEFEGSDLIAEDAVLLAVHTRQSRVRMAQAARTRIFLDGAPAAIERDTRREDGYIAQHLTVNAEQKRPLRIEKMVSIVSSKDPAISEPTLDAKKHIQRVKSFDELLDEHVNQWLYLWDRCDVSLTAPGNAQRVLRLHIMHLIQTVSTNSIDRDIGVPPRGWHGEAYRGHIFWDELFIFPYLSLSLPELSRSLLMYRYRRLDEARHAASQAGLRGAMFPWQSGSDGREESQEIHLNPRSGRWIPDNTHLQRHVNAAIVYNVWRYYQATSDIEFLSFYGAEMILEIAQFFSTIARYNPDRERYEIRHVVGPDEYHTHYPDSDALGLNNNAYTNIMASWTLTVADKVLELLADSHRDTLLRSLQITPEDIERWRDVSKNMFVPFHDEAIISQFEGYEELEEFDWRGYRQKYGDIERLDRILEAENDSPNRYKASKQADVLMLFYLLSSEELESAMSHMGYDFDPETIPRMVDYYASRTSHGSTLSRVIYSWVFARTDRCRSWRSFEKALQSDVCDTQGGTTPEGIHLGAMAGTVDLAQRCYTGLEVRDDVLWLNPRLPRPLTALEFRIRYREHWILVSIRDQTLYITFERGREHTVMVGFRNEVYEFEQGQQREFSLM